MHDFRSYILNRVGVPDEVVIAVCSIYDQKQTKCKIAEHAVSWARLTMQLRITKRREQTVRIAEYRT